ncbi:hypothetical protein ACFQY4_46090 [Catellatospora bangladeshensis]|uniref:hypothetical protein n=1 Tax=Catellatospora bangladeshensis TaxID=310355 RepID=UPI00360F703A
MLDFIVGMIGGWLGASWSQRRELRRARARQAALLAGEPVRVPCAMRELGAGQTQWRHGDLLLTAGRAWWTPPGMSSRKVSLGPAGLTVTGDRPVTAQEGWGLNPPAACCRCALTAENWSWPSPVRIWPPRRRFYRWRHGCNPPDQAPRDLPVV